MNIAYFDPLSRAWNRMTTALFKPFDIGKWFVVGFTAFLAGLMDWPEGGSNDKGRGHTDLGEIIAFPDVARQWLTDNPGWFTLIVMGLLLLIAFVVLLTWLSSRGKFMFLDNVVHDRAKVSQPWREYKTHGNSLFVWRLCFGIVCLAVFAIFAIMCFNLASDIYYEEFSFSHHVLEIIGLVLLALLLFVVIAYISLFLTDFVVPIMYKNNITALQGWSRYLGLFEKHWLRFILYGLLVLVLWILVVMGVFIVGILTCCVGFLLLIIPYISSVILLPISYTFRSFSLEFLQQFGPEFDVFPKVEDS
jgi:hypothetical protein